MQHSVLMFLGRNTESILKDFQATVKLDGEVEVHIVTREEEQEEFGIEGAELWRPSELDDMLDTATLDADELHVIANGGTTQQQAPLLMKLTEVTDVEIHIYDVQRDGIFQYNFDDKNWRKID